MKRPWRTVKKRTLMTLMMTVTLRSEALTTPTRMFTIVCFQRLTNAHILSVATSLTSRSSSLKTLQSLKRSRRSSSLRLLRSSALCMFNMIMFPILGLTQTAGIATARLQALLVVRRAHLRCEYYAYSSHIS